MYTQEYPVKFIHQTDIAWPPDSNNDSQVTGDGQPPQPKSPLEVEKPNSPQRSPQRSPYKMPVKSPRPLGEVPECLEVDMGLFSKFKNTRLPDEFSIYEPKTAEDKYSFMSNLGSHVPGATNNNEQASFRLEIEQENTADTKKPYGKGYVMSILLTVFSIEFAGALEIVYITPYFLKLELNEWIDATFWMFPLVFTTLLKAPISILAGHKKCQRPTLFVMMFLSAIGCFMFTYADEITLRDVIPWEDRRILMTWLGLFAFCFIDVANEMISVIQNRVIEENEQMCDSLNKKSSFMASFAKIFGYFCGSLQALKISYYQVLERNMDACFLFAGAMMVISTGFCFFFQRCPGKGYEGSLIPKFRSLRLSHFLPSFRKAISCSPKMKLILLSHFFAAGNIVMLSVYATSWVGQNVLQGDPLADLQSMDIALFEEGVSWGSLGLMITSFVILIVGWVLHKMLKHPQKKKFKILHIVSQLFAALALFICICQDDLKSVFLIIPLTGLAFQTFHAVPEILAEILETEEGVNIAGTYRRLLEFTFFYAQVLMWLVVPLIFIFFPDRDDNLWGMLVAASSGLASVFFAIFL